MNTQRLRMKNSKRGVTPVIATIILIAGTLVLALVVGAYTFGLFGSNVKTVTLSSATLYGGTTATGAAAATSSLTIALNNPGSASYITSVTMTGSGIATIVAWDNNTALSTAGNLIRIYCKSPRQQRDGRWNGHVIYLLSGECCTSTIDHYRTSLQLRH